MHDIYLERAAERDLKKLDPVDFDKIIGQIKALSGNPRPSGCRKIRGSVNDWCIRAGTYRIIYEIDDKAKSIRIYRIRHRKEVYR